MKLQFDSQQSFQIDAVNAVVDLFDGQPLNRGDFEVSMQTQQDWGLLGQVQMELGLGNRLVLSSEDIFKNLQSVQSRNDLDLSPRLESLGEGRGTVPYNFSVEMETGTGKTYVYLRTILELSLKYGFKKFIIVVPSVAIREGVLKNLEITKDHFRNLFNNIEYEHFVYDSQKLGYLRQFAVSNQIQIMVINIDAFRKNFTGTETETKSNVIYRESDRLSGRPPIEYVQATNPIVIIDEPQSVDNTEKAQEAIKTLNPLCVLRYSATHRNPYNLVYKLDPVRAYEMRLVKQIVVASVTSEGGRSGAFVKLQSVDYGTAKLPRARVLIQVVKKNGVEEKKIPLKNGSDLYQLSGELAQYRNGYVVTEISGELGNESVSFNNGIRLSLGQEQGGPQDEIWKTQIRNTIQRHLEKEVQVWGKGIKVLSLFFIDRVGNYRAYAEDNQPKKGKLALYFEEAYKELTAQERFKSLQNLPVEKVHGGYFAQDKKGVVKESREGRPTEADEDAYNLIMKDKERLLSSEEPLKFIFSHSALREGWDNPNVFQICTLNETRSALKKRQEIGRGLRLPVNQNGERIFDDTINRLLVVANESYEDFAKKLQQEYEEDCGVTFGKISRFAFSKLVLPGQADPLGRDSSVALWERLKAGGYLDADGKILSAFQPDKPGFVLSVPEPYVEIKAEIIDILKSYRLEKHIKREGDQRRLRFKKELYLDTEFGKLWDKIKQKTLYSVEYATEDLLREAINGLRRMATIESMKVTYAEAKVDVAHTGVQTTVLREGTRTAEQRVRIPDLIEYLQNKTELTRGTLVKILIGSGRLGEFLINPQVFMDQTAAVVERVLHNLILNGIKYEKINGEFYEMRAIMEKGEVVAYLEELLEAKKSAYDYVFYESQVEKDFALALENNPDIKVFLKLPPDFKVDTPVGTYNPDWAIVKHGNPMLYLVRETKSTLNFKFLRQIEEQKTECGKRHFEAIGTDYKIVTDAKDI